MTPITWRPTSRQALALAIIFLLILIAFIEYQVLSYTKGVFVYPQDDAYIRMAIAKNLAFNQVWGISRHEFAPASSSLLYPFILAAVFFIFGSHLIISFIINVVAAVVLLVVMQKWLARQGLSPLGQLLALLAAILLIPLPILVVIGMEHVLQILFSFLFIYRFCDWLSQEQNSPVPQSLLGYGFLVTAIRYEGLFLIGIACIFLLVRRRLLHSLLLGGISILPVLVFGFVSISKGGYFLPNSIMLKSIPVPFNGETVQNFFGDDMVNRLLFPFPSRGAVATGRLLIILPLLYWFFIGTMRASRQYRYLVLFCLGITALHVIFANAILFYRYEAYLIGCAIPIAGLLLGRHSGSVLPRKGAAARWIAAWTAVFLLYPLLSRSWEAYKDTGKGALNMYEQDFAAASFLHQYYNKVRLIIDDLGAISYMTEGRKMDLSTGIGTMEIIRSKEEGYYRMEYQDLLVGREKPVLAVISERKYNGWLVRNWKKVASWHTYNTVTMGDLFICFYAVNPDSAPDLKKSLEAYEPYLPPGVKANYFY